MEFKELLNQTRTVHKFENKTVPRNLIKESLELSLQAPNHKLTFPWNFHLLSEGKKQDLFEIIVTHKCRNEEITQKTLDNLSSKFLWPEIVFISLKKKDNKFEEREDYATLACSIQLIALNLAGYGIHYKWSTGQISRLPEVYKLLSADPESSEIIGMIMIGYGEIDGERKRPELSEVLTLV